MTALFVALGIAVLTLLALLLWFVPHLLQQQAQRTALESAKLRDMLLDMLSEQEAVTMRQTQLGTSLAHLQDQLEQMVTTYERVGAQSSPQVIVSEADQAALHQLEHRIGTMQNQIQTWLDYRNSAARTASTQDNEAWGNLLGLLAAIQDRVGTLSAERASNAVGLHATTLLEELDQEMRQLRSISEDIATLQWRLRRSLHERESNMSVLRAQATNSLQ